MPGENPDPENAGRRYHRPTTGLRAAGYRDGWAAALGWVVNEHPTDISDLLRDKLAVIIKRSHR
jgi:hypothetical protein